MKAEVDVDTVLMKSAPMCKPVLGATLQRVAVDVAKPGCLIGKVHREGHNGTPIYSAGPVSIGPESVILGVTAAAGGFYIYRGGRLAIWPRSFDTPLSQDLGDPREAPDVAAWANRAADRFLEFTMGDDDRASIIKAEQGYHVLVEALVNRTVVDLAASHPSLKATWAHIARGCHHSWGQSDLFHPRPSIRHALIVSLACGATAQTAAVLIARAALLELRLPLIDEGSAARMYTAASAIMAKGCPAWWQMAAATNWNSVGTSVAATLGGAFWAGLGDAKARDRTLIEALGLERGAMLYG